VSQRQVIRSRTPAYKQRLTPRRRRKPKAPPKPLGKWTDRLLTLVSLVLTLMAALFVAARFSMVHLPPRPGYALGIVAMGGVSFMRVKGAISRSVVGVVLVLMLAGGLIWLE